MTLNLKIAGIIALMAATAIMLTTGVAFATALFTGNRAMTAAATTTVVYMSPGNATTTLVYDSYEVSGTNQTNSGNLVIPDTVALAVQGVSSSSVSVLNIACEYSYDNIDWYQNNLYSATSSGIMPIVTPSTFSYTFASTTLNGVSIGNNYAKIVECPIVTRYVRAVLTNTGARMSVWATFIPTKQSR